MPQTAASSKLLRTKLYRPPLSHDHVLRPRLLAQLEEVSHYQLAMITAPAGYGKSTLVSAWIEQVHCPSAWLSLDEKDNSLVVFIGYFVAAIQSVFPEFGEQIREVAQSASRASLPTIDRYLLSEIDQLEQDFVLVLDDLHLLTNPEIHEFLGALLQYPLPHFHLVLISRHDLPPQLSKLRAQSRLIELRASDLRFSQTEVGHFVEKTLPARLDEDTVRNLAENTEGWAVGLRLAIIAIRRWGVDDHQPSILQVENPYILEYLVSEVVTRQSPTIRDFLLKSSILDQFCVPLCAAMMDIESLDPNILGQLEREGLFIESLDNQNEWYRYHHLFRQLLRNRLKKQFSSAEIEALHLRASRWLAANGFLEAAIDHALASGDVSVAINILSKRTPALLNGERWLLLENLLNKFPPAVINDDPILLLLLAWLNVTRMQLEHVESIREKLEEHLKTGSLMPEEMRLLACSLHTFATIRDNWISNYEGSICHAGEALALTKPEWGLLNAYIWVHLGTATHQLKGGQAGLTVLIEENHLVAAVLNRVRKHIAIGFVDWMTGDLLKLLHTAQNGLAMINDSPLFTSKSMLHLHAGSACYARNDLALAEQHFNTILNMKHGFQFQAFILSAIGLALIYQAQNRVGEAWQMSETAVNFCLEMEHAPLLFVARAFQAELSMRQGQLDRASLWANQIDATVLTKLMPYHYQSQLILPKVWLTEGTASSHRLAEAELLRLSDIVTTNHNIPCQILVLAMQSLLYHANNKANAAEDALVQAVHLAQPGGFIRVFVDLGPKMEILLRRLYFKGIVPSFIQQILGAFPASKPLANGPSSLALIESLTEREMEVLSLLAQRLSNKEIAKTLIISTETVKRHTSNIYQKLQVRSRRQAVAKAYTLNILVEDTD
jgi:LuxR family maltose regulon positive regulatory protein